MFTDWTPEQLADLKRDVFACVARHGGARTFEIMGEFDLSVEEAEALLVEVGAVRYATDADRAGAIEEGA
jgi:hypothetical protein